MNSKNFHTNNTKEDWDGHWSDIAEIQDNNPAAEWRRRLISDIIKKNSKNKKNNIIDFGSGTGALLRHIIKTNKHYKVLGLEQSHFAVSYACSLKQSREEYIETDLFNIRTPPTEYKNWADIGVCSEVIEHMENPNIFIEQSTQWLNSNALLIITVPGGPYTKYMRYIGHVRHYTCNELRELLIPYFSEVITFAAGFPFYNLQQTACLLAGKKLIQETQNTNKISPLLSLAYAIFRPLFYLNYNKTPFGWQTVALAYIKSSK